MVHGSEVLTEEERRHLAALQGGKGMGRWVGVWMGGGGGGGGVAAGRREVMRPVGQGGGWRVGLKGKVCGLVFGAVVIWWVLFKKEEEG